MNIFHQKKQCMKQITDFLGKLAVSIILVIFFEGLVTMGIAFDFNTYPTIAWIFQGCVLMVCIWVSTKEWED